MADTKTGLSTAELLQLLMQGGQGVASGIAQGRQNSVNQGQQQQNQLNESVQRMMNALQNAQNTGQGLQMNRQNMPETQASMSPLGQEQSFVQKQRMMAAMLPQVANFSVGGPTDPAIAAAYTPPTNLLKGFADPKLQASYGDDMTAQSLADRRKLMAQINPDYEFSSLGGFGLDPSYDNGVNQASANSAKRLSAYENAQSSLANQQTQLANTAMQNAQNQPQQKQGGGGIGGFLGNILKVAAPAAAFIPAVGPLASVGIGAAAGALGNKMSGGSLAGGALQGGLGAAGGEVLQSLRSGQGFNPFNNGKAPIPSTGFGMTPFAGSVSPQGAGNLPNSNLGGFSPFQQGVSQQPPPAMSAAPSGPSGPKPMSKPQGFNPQGYPLANPAPYRNPNQGPQMGAQPGGVMPPPIDKLKQLQDQIANNPMVSGYTGKPAGIGGPQGLAMAGFQRMAGPQLGAGPQMGQLGAGASRPQLGPGPQPRALPQGQYNMGPVAGVGPNQPALNPGGQGAMRQLQEFLARTPPGTNQLADALRKLMGAQ